MDLLKKTKELCREFNIKPARSRGQNFLITETIYDEIVNAAEISENDTVLEVGPGLGFLTTKLAKKAKKVIAVELDKKLAEYLRIGIEAKNIKNIDVINANILDFDPSRISQPHPTPPRLAKASAERVLSRERGKYKIVANLPYNITSIFLRKFLSGENKPELMVLMLQKEVAERIVAKPGDMSILALSVQFYADPELIRYVSKENFWPQPEVDSAIIKLKIKNYELRANPGKPILITVDKERDFFRLVKFGFSAKRKMLKNNLSGGLKIDQKEAENCLKLANITLKARAEDLSLSEWIKLFEVTRQNML